MAIEQNSTITVGSGSDARTFGISKSLNNYTIDELLGIGEWAYSAYNDDEMNANVYSDISTSGTMIDIADGQYASRVVCYPDNQLMSKGYNTNSEGVFFRNVLIYYDVTETNWASSSVNVDAGRFQHYYVVTDIDLQDLVIDALSDPNAVASSYTTMKLGVNDVTIAPFQLYLDQNGELSLNMLLPPVGGRSSTINPNSDLVCYSALYGNWSVYTASGGYGRNIKDQMPFHFFNPNHVDYPFQDSRIPGTQVLTDADKLIQCVKTDAPDTPARFHFQYKVELMDKPYIDSARCGIRFKISDTVYKPIVENGMITGYTDDDSVTSEWDTWENIKDHVTPSVRPSGGGDDDDPSDDQAWGGAYSGAGAFSKFYLCTATDLANLRTWFGGGGGGDPIPDGFDPMGQVIGLLQYPVSISGTALAPDEIIFRSGKTILHTGVNADRSTGGFLHLDCGSVDVPRRMQERGVPFLDFETSLEIYVPFCGTAPLDVQTCVGKTLTCDMYVATATGDVSAIIAAGGHPVAYMSGNMAESLPISSSGYGMYLAACKSTWGNGVSQVMNQLTGGTTSTIKNVNQAALNETLSYGQTGGWGQSELLAESYNNPAIGRGMAGAASVKGAAAIGLATTALNVANAASTGYEQYQRVKNASYTSVSGSFTSCAAWNYPFTPYVKITRPHKQIPTGGKGGYKHTAAIPLVETKTLSGAPGLTTCVNPDVSGISNATAQEKDIIYRALVNGVIV